MRVFFWCEWKQSKKKRILTLFYTIWNETTKLWEKFEPCEQFFFAVSVCVCAASPFKLHSWCVFNWALLFWIHAKCCFLNLYNQSVYKKEIIWRVFLALSLYLAHTFTHPLSHSLISLLFENKQSKFEFLNKKIHSAQYEQKRQRRRRRRHRHRQQQQQQQPCAH